VHSRQRSCLSSSIFAVPLLLVLMLRALLVLLLSCLCW
jgi:hypothetical protein